MILGLALAAAASASSCSPVKDADSLWASAETRWIVVGEMHGSNETPDAFTNLVCLAAAARGPVTVALELPQDMQPVLDTWLASDGGDKAKAALLAAPWWHRPLQDGRSSIAFLRMLERLRTLHVAGKVVAVRGFDEPATWRGATDRNADMAGTLIDIAATTKGLTMVLVGNVHAARSEVTFGTKKIRPATFLLPEGKRVSVNVDALGGSVWACMADGCHAQDMGPTSTGSASITWNTAPDRRYDVIYRLGVPFTVAEPAVAGVANIKPLENGKAAP